jgi:malonyl-ACP O-methyltransferase BioC
MTVHPDKHEVARRFKRSLATYDENAVVQKRVSARLIDLLQTCKNLHFARVLEVGCCTGILTKKLCNRYPVGILYLNDLVPELCELAGRRIAEETLSPPLLLPGDIEETVLPDNLDLIVSSSTLQWLRNFPEIFSRFAEALRDGGYLVFSFFGDGTLLEMRELTGRGLCYPGLDQFHAILEPQFTVLTTESWHDELLFSDPRAVLRHLQATGVSSLGNFRWTPTRLREFEQKYRERYSCGDEVRLSYTSHCIVARKKGGRR